ncbi:AAA family ATPase [Streptomyces beihaiensis]|uniref:Secreted protein n=1 Tax=Streptomyces beihaiensis TaxID=2984495 RepID=A0ABT3U4W7_9ACTN|nr:hypothetical protein [Streptomyces beihaiensis]MCX3064353.1 hypothetical protein [Streptomyces beihaiensis]
MGSVIAIIALIFVAFLVLGAYITVKAVGAAKRGVDRRVEQARRAVEDTTLRARSLGTAGAASELAQLRLKLRQSMRATQDALHARVAEDASLQESLGLFERLSAHGHDLDAELKRLESEPDKAYVRGLLPDLARRTEKITASADALRHAARDRAEHFAQDDLEALSRQIDVESGALRHWTTRPPSAATQEPPATGQGPAPRQEIPPSGVRPVYPWQRKPRPESTT